MKMSSTIFRLFIPLLLLFVLAGPRLAATQATSSDKAYPHQLTGTVVDPSGAVIAGATVQVWSANGTAQKTAQSDTKGSFILSGLAAGNYRLVVSNSGFETKEIPVSLGATEAQTPLRISLAVSAVSTTVNVQGREDDLIGIAESGTQGTVGATEIQDRPILRSGEVLETVPGLIITQHAGGGKAKVAGIIFPFKPSDTLTVMISRGELKEETWDYVNLNPFTGEAMGVWHRGASYSLGDRIINLLGPIHFGTDWGLFVKIVWAMAGLALPALFLTGTLMYWNRSLRKKWMELSGKIGTSQINQSEAVPNIEA